jgi:hypothetical protein
VAVAVEEEERGVLFEAGDELFPGSGWRWRLPPAAAWFVPGSGGGMCTVVITFQPIKLVSFCVF